MWLRSPKSEWGWLPAKIVRKEVVAIRSESKPSSSNKVGGGADNGTGLKDAYGRYRTSAAVNSRPSSGGDDGGNPLPKSPDDSNDTIGSQSEGELVQPVAEEQASMAGDEQKQQQGQQQLEDVKEKKEDQPIDATSSPDDTMIELTLVDDFDGLRLEGNNTVVVATGGGNSINTSGQNSRRKKGKSTTGDYYANAQPFTEIIRITNNAFVAARGEEHPDIKLRNIPMTQYGPSSNQNKNQSSNDGGRVDADGSSNNDKTTTPALTMMIQDTVTGGVDDLIGLTHLHEPAILHAIRLRYDADIIYTSTGPILLAINPFKVSRHSLLLASMTVKSSMFLI